MDEYTSKACSKCGEVKPLDEFYPRSSARDGRYSDCKECNRARRRAYAKANRDKESAYRAQWVAKNKARHDEYMSNWRTANREALREYDQSWRDSNRDLKRSMDRRFRAENAEAIRRKRADNLEFFRERDRAYRESGAHAERERRRRAAKRGVRVERVDLDALWTGRCGLCGGEMDQEVRWPDPMSKSIDHVQPLSLGGEHILGNLQWAHLRCNVAKGNRTQNP